MKIVVYGTGYVGLVAGTCYASIGHEVTCLDNEHDKVKKLNNGIVPIYEAGLDELVAKAVSDKKLSFCHNSVAIDSKTDLFVIAVGTPSDNNGSAYMGFVQNVVSDIIETVGKFSDEKSYCILVKSTVPVGTAKYIRDQIAHHSLSSKLHVISNPEFLREGRAVKDFLEPDRVVIGVSDKSCNRLADSLYRPMFKSSSECSEKLFYTSNVTAEMIKYFTNGYLSYRISFINQAADLCENVGADLSDLMRGLGMDSRIGSSYLSPGPGFGGSCFPKDTRELIYSSSAHSAPLTLLQNAVNYNEERKLKISHSIQKGVERMARIKENQGKKEKVKVLILGVAFKEETDDIRESVSLSIIDRLVNYYGDSVSITVHDPKACANFNSYIATKSRNKAWRAIITDHDMQRSIETSDYDVLIVATRWKQFVANRHLEESVKDKKSVFMYDLHNIVRFSESKDDIFNSEQKRLFLLGQNLLNN